MIVKTNRLFKFYTYDIFGRDAVIVLLAMDQAEAWIKFGRIRPNLIKFGRIHGEQTPVDIVEMIGE